MSATGLDVFDKTLHTTNLWLKEIMEEIGPDRSTAWKVLSVVLHKLRDRLPLDNAAHLGAQLPILVRGAYYDGFKPSRLPGGAQTADDFIEDVKKWLADTRPVDAKDAIRAVFTVLEKHVSAGEIEHVKHALPKSIRTLWPEQQPA